jgi:hypothetical protein
MAKRDNVHKTPATHRKQGRGSFSVFNIHRFTITLTITYIPFTRKRDIAALYGGVYKERFFLNGKTPVFNLHLRKD